MNHKTSSDAPAPAFLIGVIEVLPSRNVLRSGGEHTAIEPRVMAVLCMLARQAREVVPRDDLIATLWGVDSADDSLTRAISVLRKTIEALGGSRTVIETIPKRGYRLACSIKPLTLTSDKPPLRERATEQTAPESADAHAASSHRGLVAAGLAIALFGVLLFLRIEHTAPEAGDTPVASIAVLPFVSISAEQDDQLFADGLSEELINALASVPGLNVSGRTSSFSFMGSSASIKDIGEALEVDHVLEGSLRRVGKRVRVTAQLNSALTGYRLWSDVYDRALDDIFSVQEEIAQQVAAALTEELTLGQDQPLFNAGTSSALAFDSYVRARDLLDRRGLGLSRAIAQFEDAIVADSEYARAYAGLATAHAVSHIYLNVPKMLARERARNFAKMALSHDPQLAEPHAVLGAIEANQNNWSKAIAHYKDGEEINPYDVTTLQWHAELLNYVGYLDQANERIERALDIEPESAVLHLIAGNIAYSLNDLEGTETHYGLAGTFGFGDGTNGYTFIEVFKGNFERASELMARTQFTDQRISAESVPKLSTFLLGIMRREHDVDSFIGQFPTLAEDDDFLVTAYLIAGQSEKALRLLESDPDGDQDSHFLLWSPLDPNLRRVPYFSQYVRNTGLTKVWDTYGLPNQCTREQAGSSSNRIVCQ